MYVSKHCFSTILLCPLILKQNSVLQNIEKIKQNRNINSNIIFYNIF